MAGRPVRSSTCVAPDRSGEKGRGGEGRGAEKEVSGGGQGWTTIDIVAVRLVTPLWDQNTFYQMHSGFAYTVQQFSGFFH